MLIAEQNETKHRAQNMKVSLYCVTASEKNRLNKSLAPLKHIVKEWTFSVDGRMWKCYELYKLVRHLIDETWHLCRAATHSHNSNTT